MQAKDIMNANVVSVTPDTAIGEIAKLLADRHISAAPVVDADNRIVGIVSEGDLVRRADRSTFKGPKAWWLAFVASPERRARDYIRDHGTRAQDVMTREVVSVAEDASLHEIAVLLEKHRIKRVPVTRDGRLAGIVSRANLLRGFAALSAGQPVTSNLDDQSLRQKIINEIRDADPSMVDFADVVVKDGEVQLWGGVSSKEQVEAIELAARNVPGVRKVENHVSVLPQIIESTMWAE